MSFQVRVDARADRGLGRCPRRVQLAIIEFLYGPLAANPLRGGKPLGSQLTGLYSARKGEYRVLYEIDEDTKLVRVCRIAHRAYVCRPG